MYFGVVVVVVILLVVTGEKQSQLLVPRLGLEFDKRKTTWSWLGSFSDQDEFDIQTISFSQDPPPKRMETALQTPGRQEDNREVLENRNLSTTIQDVDVVVGDHPWSTALFDQRHGPSKIEPATAFDSDDDQDCLDVLEATDTQID